MFIYRYLAILGAAKRLALRLSSPGVEIVFPEPLMVDLQTHPLHALEQRRIVRHQAFGLIDKLRGAVHGVEIQPFLGSHALPQTFSCTVLPFFS